MQDKWFTQRNIQIVIYVITFFLQLISFVTTWQGAKLYFSNVFMLAPLLFAIAVQSIVYFLCNSLKDQRRPLMVIALTLALTCSSYFSYVGVYTSIRPSEVLLEMEYAEARQQVEDGLKKQKSDYEHQASELVMDFYQQLTMAYQNAKLKQERLASQLTIINQLQPTQSQALLAPNPNYYADYEAYAQAYQQYIQSLSDSSNTEMSESLKRTLQSFEVDSVDELNERYLESCNELNTFQLWLKENPQDALIQLQPLFQSLDCKAEIEKFAPLLKIDAQPILEAIDQAEALQDFTLPTYEELKNEDVLKTQLACNQALQKAAFFNEGEVVQIDDVYMLPIKHLVQRDTLLLSFSCLFLACLVDGLTLIFASIYWRKGFVMKKKSIAGLQNDEAFFASQVDGALALAGMNREQFLKRCEVDDTYLKQGYSMFIVSKEKNEDVLLSILMQLNVVKWLDQRYYIKSKFIFFLNGKEQGDVE